MKTVYICSFAALLLSGCRSGETPADDAAAKQPPVSTVKAGPAAEQETAKREDSAMKMTVRKATEEEIAKLGIKSWPIWTYDPEAQPPEFPWHYDSREVCYIIEGEVTVEADGQKITFGPGDIVEFPKDLDCVWKVDKAVRKHYRFD